MKSLPDLEDTSLFNSQLENYHFIAQGTDKNSPEQTPCNNIFCKIDSYSILIIGLVALAFFSIWWGGRMIQKSKPSNVVHYLHLILITFVVTTSGSLALMFSTNIENQQNTNACISILGTALGYAVGSSQSRAASSDSEKD